MGPNHEAPLCGGEGSDVTAGQHQFAPEKQRFSVQMPIRLPHHRKERGDGAVPSESGKPVGRSGLLRSARSDVGVSGRPTRPPVVEQERSNVSKPPWVPPTRHREECTLLRTPQTVRIHSHFLKVSLTSWRSRLIILMCLSIEKQARAREALSALSAKRAARRRSVYGAPQRLYPD